MTEYKQNNSYYKISDEKPFDPRDQVLHFSLFLKTFGYEPGKPMVARKSPELKDNQLTALHYFMRILKRYYYLYNTLIEAAEALKKPMRNLLQNTRFENHFDLCLFKKYMFQKLIREDYILNEIIEVTESFNSEYLQDFDGAHHWANKVSEIDYPKQRIQQDSETLKFYKAGWMYTMTETDIFIPYSTQPYPGYEDVQ